MTGYRGKPVARRQGGREIGTNEYAYVRTYFGGRQVGKDKAKKGGRDSGAKLLEAQQARWGNLTGFFLLLERLLSGIF